MSFYGGFPPRPPMPTDPTQLPPPMRPGMKPKPFPSAPMPPMPGGPSAPPPSAPPMRPMPPVQAPPEQSFEPPAPPPINYAARKARKRAAAGMDQAPPAPMDAPEAPAAPQLGGVPRERPIERAIRMRGKGGDRF